MRIMKYLSMAALTVMGAMTIASCDNEDNAIVETPQTGNNVITVTTTVSRDGGDATTRALTEGGVKTFSKGDQIAVVYENTSNETVKAVSDALPDGDYGSTATFTVTLTNPKAGGSVKYIYPAAMAKTDGTVNYDALDTQDGTLTTLAAKLDLAIYNGTLTASAGLPASATLVNQLAICKFTLKNSSGDDITSTITRLTISDLSSEPYDYTVRPSSLSTIWVAMRHVTHGGSPIQFTANDNGTNFYKKLASSKSLYAGYLYPITVTMESCPVEAVDLGLSVKWANMNVGATSETDPGFHLYWAATTGYLKGHSFTIGNTPYYTGDGTTYNGTTDIWSKYTTAGDVLDASDDAAVVNWGGNWRMPTIAEINELLATKNNTTDYTWTWCDGSTTQYGTSTVKGWKIEVLKDGSAKGNTLFLPFTGYCNAGTMGVNEQYEGWYWSKTLATEIDKARVLYLAKPDNTHVFESWSRCYGISVRAVLP